VFSIGIFLVISLLAIFPIIFSWYNNKLKFSRASLAIYALSIMPSIGVFAVMIYDQFFHISRGVPGHQYLILLLTPVAVLISIGYICHIVYTKQKKQGNNTP